ncbi:MAG: hypothetical protein ABH829_04110 [archaeon]
MAEEHKHETLHEETGISKYLIIAIVLAIVVIAILLMPAHWFYWLTYR